MVQADDSIVRNYFMEAIGKADSDLIVLISRAARQKYEGRNAIGSIWLYCKDDESYNSEVDITKPAIDITETGLRKLIEMCPSGYSLLFDGENFLGFKIGIGEFNIQFHGDESWSIFRKKKKVFQFQKLDEIYQENVLFYQEFADHCSSIFGQLPDSQISKIWRAACSALGQSNGMNILITSSAESEAQRLSSQCIRLNPVQLTDAIIQTFARIDGTTIVDLDMYVHAASAILDGDRSDHGSWERGGRFNSAVNYVETTPFPSVILTVSQDGGIEIIPPIPQKGCQWKHRRYQKLSSIAT